MTIPHLTNVLNEQFSLTFSYCMCFVKDTVDLISSLSLISVQQHHVQQMRNILHAIIINYVITLASSITSLFPDMYVQVTSFILVALEKVTLYATMFAFLTHV